MDFTVQSLTSIEYYLNVRNLFCALDQLHCSREMHCDVVHLKFWVAMKFWVSMHLFISSFGVNRGLKVSSFKSVLISGP